MSALKLTKNELRTQQERLTQLSRYLPTLQLKKALLQFEVNNASLEIAALKVEFAGAFEETENVSSLFLDKTSIDIFDFADVQHVKKHYENVAGIDIPVYDGVFFREPEYFLFDTPVWTEGAAAFLRAMVTVREKINVAEEKKRALEKELREVSIRVNLFEKILIPRSAENIKKIRVFLGDQQLAAVAQAKVAKSKILAKREEP